MKGFSAGRPFIGDGAELKAALPYRGVDLPEVNQKAPDFDAVYRAHVQDVTRWAQRLGGPTMDTEDVVQEVFLTVHKALPRFTDHHRLRGWLFRMTENAVRYRRRREKFRRWLRGTAVEVAGDVEATTRSPVELIQQRQASELVYRALDTLPEQYRTVVVMFELEGLSGEQIAELANIKVETLWVRLHRGRAMLAKRFKELSGEERS
jgi:RNA polymerase sigma-70 factor (ECF subfamily)